MRAERARGARGRTPLLLGLAAVAVICVLLSLATDPGSGTGTNLQSVDDVAALVVGAHHAKPVPTSGVARLGSVLLAATAVVVVVSPRSGRADRGALLRRHRDDERPTSELVTAGARTWRAPPATASA